MSTGLFTMVAGIACTKWLASKFGKRPLILTLTVLNATTLGFFFIIPPDQYTFMIIVNCIGTLFAGPMPALVWAMYADTADYGEWKSGRRTTALVFSALQFAQKMGLAVGAGLSGIILSLFGFVANEVQSDSSMIGIRLMFSIFPAILALMSGAAFYFYPLSDDQVAEISEHLDERHLAAGKAAN